MHPESKREYRPLKARIVEAYFHFRALWPIWYYILNRRGRLLFSSDHAALNPVQSRIANDLKEQGIAYTSLNELFPESNTLEQLRSFAQGLEPAKRRREKKSFLFEYWDPIPLLDLKNPFVQFSIHETILRIIAMYFQMFIKLNYYMLNETIPITQDDDPSYSQRWHRDPDDRKMCKVFVYLTDVDLVSGPFMYVKNSHSKGRWRNIYPQRPPHGNYPPDGAIEAAIPQEGILSCVGDAGTVIFADTSGLHKGGYSTGKARIMFTSAYVSDANPRGILYRIPEDLKKQWPSLSPIARFALRNKHIAPNVEGYNALPELPPV